MSSLELTPHTKSKAGGPRPTAEEEGTKRENITGPHIFSLN